MQKHMKTSSVIESPWGVSREDWDPWTVSKKYLRSERGTPEWFELGFCVTSLIVCMESICKPATITQCEKKKKSLVLRGLM